MIMAVIGIDSHKDTLAGGGAYTETGINTRRDALTSTNARQAPKKVG